MAIDPWAEFNPQPVGPVYGPPPSRRTLNNENLQNRREDRAANTDARNAAIAAERLRLDRERFDYERNNKPAATPAGPSPEQMAAVRAEAAMKIGKLDSLIDRSANNFAATGMFTNGLFPGYNGGWPSKFTPGTNAFNQQADVDTVSSAGALTKVMEMAAANGGKNPLTPLSEGDFANIAKSITNLDIGQSDGQFQKNAQEYRQIWQRAQRGAGGFDATRLRPEDADKALEDGYRGLMRQMQGKPPAVRQEMLRRFEADDRIQTLRRMAPTMNQGLRPPPRRSAQSGSSDAELLAKYGVR